MKSILSVLVVALLAANVGAQLLASDGSTVATGVLRSGESDNSRDGLPFDCLQVIRPARVTVTISPAGGSVVDVLVNFAEGEVEFRLDGNDPSHSVGGLSRNSCITDVTVTAVSGRLPISYTIQDQHSNAS